MKLYVPLQNLFSIQIIFNVFYFSKKSICIEIAASHLSLGFSNMHLYKIYALIFMLLGMPWISHNLLLIVSIFNSFEFFAKRITNWASIVCMYVCLCVLYRFAFELKLKYEKYWGPCKKLNVWIIHAMHHEVLFFLLKGQ